MFHHKFHSHEPNWDIHDKELWAIVYAFDHYRQFLSGNTHPVDVISDHRNLAKFMFSIKLLKSHDGRLGRWWETLSQNNFVIRYREGGLNMVADFLSRSQQDAPTADDGLVLLPAKRFSAKALADIESWFRKSGEKNIRQPLEDGFLASSRAKTCWDNERTQVVPSPIRVDIRAVKAGESSDLVDRTVMAGPERTSGH